MQTITVLAGT